MKNKFLQSLGPLFGLILFAVALWILHHELGEYHYNDIVQDLWELPTRRLLLALALTILSYSIMTGYDALALRYIRHPLAYVKIALASFIGYSFSNNIGLSMIAGGSVRYRLYSAWNLSTIEITEVVAFCSLTLWLGFFSLGGVVFLFEPVVVPEALHLPFASVRPLGMIFLVLVGGYVLWSALRKSPLKLREWEFPLPSIRLSLIQIIMASLDWILAGSVLYSLLPATANLSYPGFLGIFLLAQIAGLASQIPGGLGVFESVIVLLLSRYLPASSILGSLLAYRGIYYLLPLIVAAVLLGTHEVFQRKEGVKRVARIFGRWVPGLVPHVLAFTTFVGGAILLFSGATPAVSWRLAWLKDFLPLPVVEISHFFGSLAGIGLLILAWGLQRRLDAAYILTVALFGIGSILSLLKGFDYEEAIALSVMLAAVVPCRRYFYRKAALFSQRFTPGWIAAITLVLLGSVWLGIFSYKHVGYSHDLWWRFALSEDAPRFLRATVAAIAVGLFFAMANLLRPAPPKPTIRGSGSFERVVAIVQQSEQTYANLALLGDKAFLLSQKGNAFIMYSIEGRSWVAMGDPIGPVEEWSELAWRFREMCDRYDGWAVFYEVGSESLPRYLDLGLTLLKLGEEGRVPLKSFSLDGSNRKGLRHTCHKLEKEGCRFEAIPKERVPSLLPELKGISDAWLANKTTREKGFSLGFFNPEYLKRFPAGIVRKEGKIVAFANIWPGAGKEELSVDLMRYLPGAPHGIMEYLFISVMVWGKQKGYHWFDLGMAPLSGLEDQEQAPLWNRVGAFIFRHGEHFYNFQGLRQYKEKFYPEWKPKDLASPGGLALPLILTNIASLISGGIKGA
ncbi:MAG: bifunctional lysylphosphatidylglycerol flippase/synthetase MprF, partial [Thermodesulfobacteriota bacterium]